MTEQFVPYEIAILLKEKGFDEPCFRGYNSAYTENNKPVLHDFVYGELQTNTMYEKRRLADVNVCTAPLWQQVIDWLEYKGLWITITPPYEDLKFEYTIHQLTKTSKLSKKLLDGFDFKTKYEALQAAIEHALTLI